MLPRSVVGMLIPANCQYLTVLFPHLVSFILCCIPGYATLVVIGAGFGGLLSSVRLKDAGITDIRIIERGSDLGGTCGFPEQVLD